MVAAIGVTVEAARALGLLLPVFGVAAVALGVLRHRVQSLEALRLMAAATGRRTGQSAGAVGSVTVAAGCRQFAVR